MPISNYTINVTSANCNQFENNSKLDIYIYPSPWIDLEIDLVLYNLICDMYTYIHIYVGGACVEGIDGQSAVEEV